MHSCVFRCVSHIISEGKVQFTFPKRITETSDCRSLVQLQTLLETLENLYNFCKTRLEYLSFHEETNKCTYELHTLSIHHTYMFRSPYATILRVYSIKKYNKRLCVWRNSLSSQFIKCYKILKFLT